MTATKLGLLIEQGSDFQLVVSVVGGPSSLTGYTGAMQIRSSKSSAPALYSVSPSAIAVDGTTRQVTITLPWTETVNFEWDSGLYDLVVTSANRADAYRLIEGKVFVDHNVTRDEP